MQRRTLLLYASLIFMSACSHSAAVTSPSSTSTDTTAAAPSTLSGQIVDQTTKSPIARAAVTLVDPAGTNPTLSTIADNAGTFSFANVAAGTYSLTITAPGYTDQIAAISVPVGALTLQMLKVGVQPVLPLSVAITAPPVIAVGQSSQLAAAIVYTDGTSRDATSTVKWAVTTPAAAVSTTGLLTGYIAGDTVITAAIQNVEGSVPLTVRAR